MLDMQREEAVQGGHAAVGGCSCRACYRRRQSMSNMQQDEAVNVKHATGGGSPTCRACSWRRQYMSDMQLLAGLGR